MVEGGSLADPGSDRGCPRAVPLHRGGGIVGVTNPMPQRAGSVDQLVEIGLIRLGHVVILDQRQDVISAQQPHPAGVGTAVLEPVWGLPGVAQRIGERPASTTTSAPDFRACSYGYRCPSIRQRTIL